MEHHAVDFTLQHLIALLPLLVTSLTAVVVILVAACRATFRDWLEEDDDAPPR